MRTKSLLLLLAFAATLCPAQKRLVVIDEDGAGPGGTDQMAMLALLQSPRVQVLGITMVTGDSWRDEETLHTLRMLELTGHAGIPVAKGTNAPLIRTQAETRLASAINGKVGWMGAWDHGTTESQPAVPALPEGLPTTKPLDKDAAHFLVRLVRAHPHQVTVYAAGPLTNIALALSIDPEFAALSQGIVLMGGSLNPQTDDPEFAADPRHEFNFWFDPEATHIVLRANWPRIDVTTVDISIKAPVTQQMLDTIAKSSTPTARYVAAWSKSSSYLWDELAACAWLDPSLITKEKLVYMDADLSRGPVYGNTLTWSEELKPATGVRLVHAQVDVDLPKFQKMFVELMTAPNP
jgi:inosine-uridine nucleoside N-ribohydrolase